jgi:hypothetical protein
MRKWLVSCVVLPGIVLALPGVAYAGFRSVSAAGPGGTGQASVDKNDPMLATVRKDFTSVDIIYLTFTVDEPGKYSFSEAVFVPGPSGNFPGEAR